LHLEGAFGEHDIVYEASCAIRRDAPNFFASTMLGVATSFDEEAENPLFMGGKGGPEQLEERYLPYPLLSNLFSSVDWRGLASSEIWSKIETYGDAKD